MSSLNPYRFLQRRIRMFPADDVTSRSEREVAVGVTGLDHETIAHIWRAVVRLYKTGLHPALGLCIRHRGEVVIDRAIGHARGNGPSDPPDAECVKVTPNTPFNLFSASKPVTGTTCTGFGQHGIRYKQ